MKRKLKFLVKQSLAKKMNTKWFKVANILIAICLIGLMNIDRIITAFGGDFEEKREVIVLDETGSYDLFAHNFNTIAESLGEMKNYEVKQTNESLETLKNDLKKEDEKTIIVIHSDRENYLSSEVISFDAVDTITTQLIQTVLNQVKSSMVLTTSGLSETEIASLTSPVSITKIVTNEDSQNTESKDMLSAGLILVFIVPFFFLITMLTQMIVAEINEEK